MAVDNNLKPGRFAVSSRLREAGSGGAAALVLPSGERVALSDRFVTIGRLPDCTIALPDANVSRKHTEIHPSGTAFVIVDLGSTNGTKVNGTRIDGERTLADGDIVSVGSTHLRFEAT
jgi:pSer/pThr/pTyr-binding forkhead associated (FHA) protein